MQEGEFKLTISAKAFMLVEKLAFDMSFNGEIGPFHSNRSLGELFFQTEEDAERVAERAETELGWELNKEPHYN
jgi:hypothetical protein